MKHFTPFSKILLFLVLFLGIQVGAYAQTGTIRGQIMDKDLGEPVMSATVSLKGTSIGTVTDLDGKYSLSAGAGTYQIEVRFIGYATKVIDSVVVKAGEITIINTAIGEDTNMMDEVVVEAKADQSAEAATLMARKNAGIVTDGLSAQQMSMAGDSNMGSAIKRVTGVTVQGGKYVYVRGLGDRYSKTTLNGAEIPGLDPNRNTVQMDLFPSNLIDNLIIAKTFSPDLPASFTGGYVNIITKDFPDRFTLKLSTSLTFNDQTTFNDQFLSYEGGNTDWLGTDDGTRAIPSAVKSGVPDYGSALGNALSGNPATAQQLEAANKSFGTGMEYTRKSAFLNHSHSIAVGNQHQVGGGSLGYIASLSYQRNFTYAEGQNGRFNLTGNVNTVDGLNPKYLLESEQGTETILIGGVANIAYKIKSSKIALNMMYNQSGVKVSAFRQGQFDEDGQVSENNIYQTSILRFMQRSLSSGQLKGEHKLGDKIRLEWLSSLTRSAQDDPDMRLFNNDYLVLEDGTRQYQIQSAAYADPARYFRDMEEFNWDTKFHLTIPFAIKERESKVKVGGSFIWKDRDFNEQRYDYVDGNRNTELTNNIITEFIADDRLSGFDASGNFVDFATYLRDNTQTANSYVAFQRVYATYLMGDLQLTDKLRVLTGFRFERTDARTKSDDPNKPEGVLDNNDILPALNFTYALSEKTNLRLGYGRTLARPTFREFAPFPSFDFSGDAIILGNAELERTLIDNIDLRWEMFPQPGELFSFSVFYKQFYNPIELTINPVAANLELQYRNVDEALVYGIELEARKSLGFISENLAPFSIGTNLTLIKSVVDIPEVELEAIRAEDPSRDSQRDMFNQSPYVVNAYAYYDNPEKGLSANLNFNVFGERLSIVSRGGLPNVYEQPRPSLDFGLGKAVGAWKFTFRAKNLLNPDYKKTHEFKGQEYIYDSFTRGRQFSIGASYTIE